MGTVISFQRPASRAPVSAASTFGGPGQLWLDLNGSLINVHTLAEACGLCRIHGLAGEIVDEGETVATINAQGVLRDLDQRIIAV